MDNYNPSFGRMLYWLIFEPYRAKTGLYWFNKGLSSNAAWYEACVQTDEGFEKLSSEPDFQEMIEKCPLWRAFY